MGAERGEDDGVGRQRWGHAPPYEVRLGAGRGEDDVVGRRRWGHNAGPFHLFLFHCLTPCPFVLVDAYGVYVDLVAILLVYCFSKEKLHFSSEFNTNATKRWFLTYSYSIPTLTQAYKNRSKVKFSKREKIPLRRRIANPTYHNLKNY